MQLTADFACQTQASFNNVDIQTEYFSVNDFSNQVNFVNGSNDNRFKFSYRNDHILIVQFEPRSANAWHEPGKNRYFNNEIVLY